MSDPYRQPGELSRTRWEYRQDKVYDEELDKTLTALGTQGWELVSACRIGDIKSYRLFFKRELVYP